MGEFLGTEVDSEHGTIGLSDRKMFSLMQAARWVGLQWKPALGCAERVLGKFGHVHLFRPGNGAIFEDSHRWVHEARQMKTGRAPTSYVAHWELNAAAVLLPLAKMTLAAEWCDRLVASDASPGGHGIAYTHLPKGLAPV